MSTDIIADKLLNSVYISMKTGEVPKCNIERKKKNPKLGLSIE